eukprot:NODE_420_length_8944_cov_0.479819.p4 type:complete len:117 gc:universal NODE_420_length_8944_cov_0.479819:8165-8515(+)
MFFLLIILNKRFAIKALYIGLVRFFTTFYLDISAITSNGSNVPRMDPKLRHVPKYHLHSTRNLAKYLIIAHCFAVLHFWSLFLHSVLSILSLEYLKAIFTRFLLIKLLFSSLQEPS